MLQSMGSQTATHKLATDYHHHQDHLIHTSAGHSGIREWEMETTTPAIWEFISQSEWQQAYQVEEGQIALQQHRATGTFSLTRSGTGCGPGSWHQRELWNLPDKGEDSQGVESLKHFTSGRRVSLRTTYTTRAVLFQKGFLLQLLS